MPERGRHLPAWLLSALLACVLVAVCWPTRQADFEADDFGYVRLVRAWPLRHFLRVGDMSEGLWARPMDEMRPVFALSLKLDDLAHGLDAPRQHLTNILLHTLDALLVVALVLALAPDARQAAWLAGLLFGLAPVHAEAVCWISGRVDSLATAFYLGAFVLFVRFRRTGRAWPYCLAIVVYAAGIFAKEILVTLPVLLLSYDLLLAPCPQREARWCPRALLARGAAHAPFLLLAALLLLLRALYFGTAARAERLGALRLVRSLGEQSLQLVAPFRALGQREPALGGLFLASGAAILGGLLWLLVDLWRRRARYLPTLGPVAFLAGAWYGVNLVPGAVTYLSQRHLYLPACGLAAALALLAFPLAADGTTRQSPARWLWVLLLLALEAQAFSLATQDWIDAGQRSAALRSGLERAAAQLPAGSVVVLGGVPAETGELMAWRWALPFALQPPFVDQDVYARLRLLEPPQTYYRPARVWWPARRPILELLLAGNASTEVELYDAHWNATRGELVVRPVRLLRGELRARLEAALRRPLESAEQVSDAEAERLVRRLADLVRQPFARADGHEPASPAAPGPDPPAGRQRPGPVRRSSQPR